LRTAYNSVIVEEDKKKLFTWKEQVLKVKILEIIFSELTKGKQRATSTLKFIRTFVSQIPCLYQCEGGDYVELANVQVDFQNLVHNTFNSDSAGC
jgi:translation initiation factor 2 alpha subunit (eIF-2alpha)